MHQASRQDILRCIRLPDKTTEKLEALRRLRKEQILKFYEGVPGEQQWEMNSLKKDSKDKKDKKKGEKETDSSTSSSASTSDIGAAA